jgi:hypothetical protein
MADNKLPQTDRQLEENNAWDNLSKWETLVEDRIRKLIGDGDMSWHPKAGQRLVFDDDNVPEDQRLAYKIMKDNDAVPPWMDMGARLLKRQEKLIRRIYQYARDYEKRKADAIAKGSFVLHNHAEDRWKDALRDWYRDVNKYNSELLDYNLQVPPQIGQRPSMDGEAEVAKALQAAGSRN